jgi:glyoxylase-like metal-dependent hydrolase (beta-lactamase superfamily II)
MSNLEIQQYVVGPVATNCYFLVNKNTKECIIVDPGAAGVQLAKRIDEQELKPVAILLTHGHFDHAGDADYMAETYQIPIYAADAERVTLESPEINLSASMGDLGKVYHADVFLKDGEEMILAGFSIRMLLTPGHTPGGCCYYLPKEMVLMSGDSLFCGSVGRTDFPGGSMSDLIRSLKEKVMVLPASVKVFPGHNDMTTIEQETYYNPYF